MSDLYEILKTTATKHIEAFNSPNPFDAEQVYQIRTSDCPMRFHPGSQMPPPFNGTITRTEHEPALNMLAAIMTDFRFEIHEMVVDVKKRVVSTRITGHFDFKEVGEEWKELKGYEIEYVWTTEMDEAGTKIVRMEECIDANAAQPMLARAMASMQRHGKAA